MLWSLFVVLLVLWLLGLGFHMAGLYVDFLLCTAVLALIFSLVRAH